MITKSNSLLIKSLTTFPAVIGSKTVRTPAPSAAKNLRNIKILITIDVIVIDVITDYFTAQIR